ncbi:DUF6161 domain-containing protein [Stenoxybacter acetivorans]|uniref:DUF6161 domain-containing protein n=1 Tax=Stenoxybacter acetivorans TaxID=422441 RepID=UPI0005636D3F|nr:DUF6161 domain-containing protein [Stenoxybacter acetivorans]
MPKLLTEIKVTVYGGLRELHFQTTEDLERWLDSEEPFWKDNDGTSMNQTLRTCWKNQHTFYVNARQALNEFKRMLASSQEQSARQFNRTLMDSFNLIRDGKIITSDYAIYPVIADMAKDNLNVAGLLYLTARSDSSQMLEQISSGISIKTLIDLILFNSRSKGTKDWLLPQRKELTALKNEFQVSLNEIRTAFEEQTNAIDEQQKQDHQTHSDREDQWNTLKKKMESDWEGLKRVYDEQLALLAPTQYWGDRAQKHLYVAIAFAVAFVIVLGLSICGFIKYIPNLSDTAKGASIILTLIPIAIPAFAAVWVLKMLSRLLSENLQMSRDARERETMVKTFLALMREDRNGEPMIKENDRILILHSLFRPSSVTAVDDAPPVHWFDILISKTAQK